MDWHSGKTFCRSALRSGFFAIHSMVPWYPYDSQSRRCWSKDLEGDELGGCEGDIGLSCWRFTCAMPTTSNPWARAACLMDSDKDDTASYVFFVSRLFTMKKSLAFISFLWGKIGPRGTIEFCAKLCRAIVCGARSAGAGYFSVPVSFLFIKLTLRASALRNIGPGLVISWDLGDGTPIWNRYFACSFFFTFDHANSAHGFRLRSC